jgi:hypothetical protein
MLFEADEGAAMLGRKDTSQLFADNTLRFAEVPALDHWEKPLAKL